jgi:hypothetical protein
MHTKLGNLIFGLVTLMLCLSLSIALGAEEKGKDQGLQKVMTNDNYNWFTINNLFNWYGNNGNSSYNIATGNSGLEFPKGSGNAPVYEDGVIWGGFHKGRVDPKVGGSAYRYGLQAGTVTGYGGAGETERPPFDDPTLAKYRVYKVRPDVTPTTAFADVQSAMTAEANVINTYSTMTAQTLFNRYVQDWNEWPAKDGLPAPYKDVDGNGVYDPTKDIPGQPGADQTLYYVANDLNASRTQNLYFSPPIGLEMHRTVWGYNLPGALGNTIFASTMLVNKSGAPLDSAFLVMWSDPDLGESGDDFAGCDVDRSLGFIYNGKNVDNTYGSAVPAAGYDFFQGPIVATGNQADSAVFRLKYRKGYKNLGMTTFDFFINGSAIYTDPPQGVAGGDVQWYRLMNAAITTTGAPFINPITKTATKFCLDGDPLTGKGWLDGTYGLVPGDRRICLVTGPFTLANKDTQELVVATIVGLGGDRISSIAVLKYYSDLAQSAYNTLFNISRPPPSPAITVGELEGQISITWPDTIGSTKIETWNSGGYQFEGYNVYQFPSSEPSTKSAVRLATYDIVNSVTTIFDDQFDEATGYIVSKPTQFGTDFGIKRSYRTSTDAIGKRSLINGTTYYFGVSSYSFNGLPTAKPTQLESTPALKAVVPQWAEPGVRYSASAGDTLKSIVHSGPSDGQLIAQVLNPTAMKKEGATYKVVFFGTVPNQTWSIVRSWAGKVDTVAKGLTDQAATDAGAAIIDGIDFRVVGAPLDFKYFLTVKNAAGPIVPAEQGAFAFNTSGFPLTPTGADRPDPAKQQSPGKLTASKGWGIHTGMNSPTMSYTYTFFKSRVTQADARWPVIIPYDWEIRFTATPGKALIPSAFTGIADYVIDVPFELWNIGINTPDVTTDDYRLFPYVLDVDNSVSYNLLTKAGTDTVDNGGGGPTHSISGGANDPFTDWVYWVQPVNKTPGQAGYNEILAGAQAAIAGGQDPYLGAGTNSDVMRRMVLVGWNIGAVATGPGSYAQLMPEAGTTFRIISTKPNQPTDTFTLTVSPADVSSAVAATDADRVNVYPNPYIGFNTQEADKYNRFVTFTHLPQQAVIRIFNLSGVLVRTLKKDDGTQFTQWDLRNESGFPVSAGMYVVYIDMPEIGKVKTLKLGVIPEQQFIDKW